jgi:TonB family protein
VVCPENQPPIRLAEGALREKLTQDADPAYPDSAKEANLSGVVLIEMRIDESGDVVDAELIREVHPLLDRAALDSVLRRKYSPTYRLGCPVQVVSTATVIFKAPND